jgi:hypothetical protein
MTRRGHVDDVATIVLRYRGQPFDRTVVVVVSGASVSDLPSQGGFAGYFLQTDGANLSWAIPSGVTGAVGPTGPQGATGPAGGGDLASGVFSFDLRPTGSSLYALGHSGHAWTEAHVNYLHFVTPSGAGRAQLMSRGANLAITRMRSNTVDHGDELHLTVNQIRLRPNGADLVLISNLGLAIGATGASFSNGAGVLYIANATGLPADNPSGGIAIYATGGVGYMRGASGLFQLGATGPAGAGVAWPLGNPSGNNVYRSDVLNGPTFAHHLNAGNSMMATGSALLWVSNASRLALFVDPFGYIHATGVSSFHQYPPMAPSPWIAVSGGVGLQNSWVNHGTTYDDAAYMKDALGFVVIRGLVKDGSAPGAVIFTLPAGYRPLRAYDCASFDNGGLAQLIIDPNGDVRSGGGGTTFFSLNARFYAEQ